MPCIDIVNDLQLPQELFRVALANTHRDVRQAVHCTMLTGCLRQPVLQNETDYVVNVSDLWPMLRGTLIHQGIEHPWLSDEFADDPDDAAYEVPLSRTYDGIKIVGTADVVNRGEGYIRDWKCPRSLPREPKPPHVTQVNVYRWLLNDPAITKLCITYIGLNDVRSFDVPVWEDYQVEEWLDSRLELLRPHLADSTVLPPAEARTAPAFRGFCTHCSVKAACEGYD